jgi:[pyruvate, water dikinase]-phosphate phosphotransferase / [pyruvate, water dikinase] kinase
MRYSAKCAWPRLAFWPILRPMNENEMKIIIISDGTGETASLMTKAAVIQFSDREIAYTRYKNIRTQIQIESIFQDAASKNDVIVYTLVSPELRKFTQEMAQKYSVPAIDLLGPLLNSLAAFFESSPMSQPGLTHSVNEQYFRRIAAMEFTIHHDDGKFLEGLPESDIVILGISRTSKTPLSMYLSMQGFKVSNIPIVRGIPLPKELDRVDPNRIICLTIQADVLHTIRKARLDRLGKDPRDHSNESYASMEHVVGDIEYATEIFRQNRKWPVFDVSGKALEETATEVIRIIEARKKIAASAAQGG